MSTAVPIECHDFIVIEWSINKIFTLFQNYKKVSLNDLVTCHVNNVKDIGKVIFTGSYFKLFYCRLYLVNKIEN